MYARVFTLKEGVMQERIERFCRVIKARPRTLFVLPSFVGLILALTLVGGSSPVRAAEGMWLVHALEKNQLKKWQKAGLELNIKDLYNPKGSDICDAVVKLGGGTGSFVSPNGLIVTNHHVAFGALQRSSSVKSDYMNDGFLAETRADEIPALGYNAYVLEGAIEVTKEVLGDVTEDLSDKQRHDAIEAARKKIVADAEKGKDIDAEVREVYGGSQYYLYTYLKIKDIRIVYAPPSTIGVYGGEIDNWMWPRHTGDFSFLRAYVGPDGKSAEFAQENVPYQPRKHLAFSTAPLKRGDFTMVVGYPGTTMRYRSSHSIDYNVNTYYPAAIELYEDMIGILEEESQKDRDAAIKLASTIRGLANGHKNNQGMLEGLKKHNLLAAKLEEEKALRDYLSTHPDLAKDHGGVLDAIGKHYQEYVAYAEPYRMLRWMSYVCSAMGSARTLYKWSAEQEKDDIDRDEGYMARDEEAVRRRLELADLRFNEDADKRLLAYFISKSATLAKGQRPKAISAICGELSGDALEKAIVEFVDEVYAGTKVTDKESRMKMFGMSKRDLLAGNDPMIEFAAKLEVTREELKDRSESFDGALSKLRPKLIALRAHYSGGALYPDANRTMRLSVGKIDGYSPRDAVSYDFMTTLGGVIEKDTGEEPFDVPDKLKELAKTKDLGDYTDPKAKDVPVCFLSTDDVTGGNSGSAILNGKGEIIGLVFDGNYEAISADYQVIPELTRTINVDSRYILFILDKFAGASGLLDELTVYPRLSRR